MEEGISLVGSYSRDGDYHQFEVEGPGLEDLASSLRLAVKEQRSLSVSIGDGHMEFKSGKPDSFSVSSPNGGRIVISADAGNLLRLSSRFLQMAQDADPEHVGLVHVHLDLYMTGPGSGVSDVVIERMEE